MSFAAKVISESYFASPDNTIYVFEALNWLNASLLKSTEDNWLNPKFDSKRNK